MSDTTNIEWADSTFNPWMGCTKVSPACDHCYAERDTARFGRVEWGAGKPRVRTSEANWRKPLQWNDNARYFTQCTQCGHRGICERDGFCEKCAGDVEPARRRVFCASLADVFDNEAPAEWLADLLDLIRRSPNLDWLLLTKRIGNWRARLTVAHQHVVTHMGGGTAAQSDSPLWPLGMWIQDWLAGKAPANVWIGATACNQAEADRDIPKLLATPAAVRFLSIEPMLGSIDLSRWIAPTVCCGWCGEHYSPSESIPDPEGHPMGADKCARCGQENVMGTWWGEAAINEASRPDGMELDEWDHGYKLHWVICGGESGPQARPMHPDWVRSLRDQCAEAGVAFLFKQWGEWAPAERTPEREALITMPGQCGNLWAWTSGTANGWRDGPISERVGKKAAGRMLDGKTHSGFPQAAAA